MVGTEDPQADLQAALMKRFSLGVLALFPADIAFAVKGGRGIGMVFLALPSAGHTRASSPTSSDQPVRRGMTFPPGAGNEQPSALFYGINRLPGGIVTEIVPLCLERNCTVAACGPATAACIGAGPAAE